MNRNYCLADVARVLMRSRWRVLFPTSVGLAATSVTNDGLTSIAGPVGGLLTGLAVVAVQEYRDSSFWREQDVSSILMLPVLGRVSNMASEHERRRRRFRRAAHDVIGSLVLLSSIAIFLWSR